MAPLELYKREDWKPKRLVIIRDIKTTETTDRKERHYKGLLEELQLALYARAWEIGNPGDLVVGAGISILGHKTSHFIEISKYHAISDLQMIGEKTEITHNQFRFLDEDNSPNSDPFRAWLASRISVALNVASRANKGLQILSQKNLIVNIVKLAISVMSNWKVISNEVKSSTIIST